MILKRYSSLDFILSLEISEARQYIEYLQEKEADELIYQRWLHFQNQSFEEFKNVLRPPKIEKDEVILDNVYKILESIEKKGGHNFGDI